MSETLEKDELEQAPWGFTEEGDEQEQKPAELSEETIAKLKGAYDYYIQGAEGLDKKAATDALFYMGHNPTPLNLKEFWESKKKNDNDVLSFGEFVDFFKTMPEDPEEELRRAFWFFDTNLDRTLDKEELKAVLKCYGEDDECLGEENIDNILAEVDTNSDGRIDIDEFVKMIQNGGVC